MQITDRFVRVPLSDIIVNREDRQRRDIDTTDLQPSIKQVGVLQPIIIDSNRVLVFGERRLTASKVLVAEGFKTAQNGQPIDSILVRFVEDLSPIEAQILELEENLKRKDLVWQDLVRAIGRIHQLHLKLDTGWTLAETADACRLTAGTVSMYLKVNAHLDEERVQKATTVREAYNLLDRRDQRAMGEAIQELLETTNEIIPHVDSPSVIAAPLHPMPRAEIISAPVPKFPLAEETILHQSFLEWAPKYEGRKFNFIHCDFPYGANLFNGPQAGGDRHNSYTDTKELYFELVETFCKNLERFMAISAHLMFWLSADTERVEATLKMFKQLAPSLSFYKFPLIWTKSDNAGIASDSKHGPRHIYELALLGARSSRQVVKVVADSYSAPTDKRYHVSTKPEPMLRHFMSMLVDENTTMLDPTCGSASSIRAAEELGAVRCLGMDIDIETVNVARMALKNSRVMRLGSKMV